MRTTIDAAGRIVFPKALRDLPGLTSGQTLGIFSRDGRAEIGPQPTPIRPVCAGDWGVAGGHAERRPPHADLVRDTLEQTRR